MLMDGLEKGAALNDPTKPRLKPSFYLLIFDLFHKFKLGIPVGLLGCIVLHENYSPSCAMDCSGVGWGPSLRRTVQNSVLLPEIASTIGGYN